MVLPASSPPATSSVDCATPGVEHAPTTENRETSQYPVWRDNTGFEFLPAPRGMAGDYIVSCGPLMWAISTILIPAFAKPVLPMRAVTMDLDALQSKRPTTGVSEQRVLHRIEIQRIRANSLDKGELCGFPDLASFMEGAKDAITTTELLDSTARIMDAYSTDSAEVTPSDFVGVLKEKNIRLLNDMKAVQDENLTLREKLKGTEEKLKRARRKRSSKLLNAYSRLRRPKQHGDTNSVHTLCRDSIHVLQTEIERLKACHGTALSEFRSKSIQDVKDSIPEVSHATKPNGNTLCSTDHEKENG